MITLDQSETSIQSRHWDESRSQHNIMTAELSEGGSSLHQWQVRNIPADTDQYRVQAHTYHIMMNILPIVYLLFVIAKY